MHEIKCLMLKLKLFKKGRPTFFKGFWQKNMGSAFDGLQSSQRPCLKVLLTCSHDLCMSMFGSKNVSVALSVYLKPLSWDSKHPSDWESALYPQSVSFQIQYAGQNNEKCITVKILAVCTVRPAVKYRSMIQKAELGHRCNFTSSITIEIPNLKCQKHIS